MIQNKLKMACLQKGLLIGDNCPEDQSCVHFKLTQQYRYSDKALVHFEIFRHTMVECHYERECRAFQRLIQGGYRMDDRGHCAIYRHPSRRDNAHVEKSIGSKKFITGQLEVSVLEQKPSFYDKLPILGNKELEEKLVEELESNGYGWVMKIPTSVMKISTWPYPDLNSKTLWDIADEKMNHIRHVEMGKPLTRVEILAILLYTGTDAYSDLRKTETIHYEQPEDITSRKSWPASLNPMKKTDQKWKFFSEILSNAIKSLAKSDIKKRPDVTYHGLLDVEVDPDSFFSYWQTLDRNAFKLERRIPDSFRYGTFVSTSTNRNIAISFMTGKNVPSGCLMELEIGGNVLGADISWISKFPSECEFLLDKGSEFYLKNLEFDKTENIQIAKIQYSA